jgi:hypothetical protein
MTNALRPAAQAGDIKALEALMNKAFQSREITVGITNTGSTLKILLTSAKPLDQKIANSVKQGLQNINPQGFDRVLVTANDKGGAPSWTEQWTLVPSDTAPSPGNGISGNEHNLLDTTMAVQQALKTERQTRSAYQFLQLRVQLLGRGMTNEIMNLYVNGKRLKPKVTTLHEFLNFLGAQGFRIVTAEMETEGVYTHFITLQREVFTYDPPSEDIYDTLEKSREGADFGDSVRNLLEFGMFDNF